MAKRHRTLKLYTPHEGQRLIHGSQSRFNAVCWGRQSGKTTYGLNKILGKAWSGPRDGLYWYVLQTYDAAAEAFNRVMQMYRNAPSAFLKKPNESELAFTFRHGPRVAFKSGKNYQDMRVATLNGLVVDEVRQQPPEMWSQVLRPMLTKKQGWADFLSTPNGFDHFYDLHEAAKTKKDWSSFHAPSTHAPWWTPEEIESAKGEMSEAVFAQEILGEFRDLTSGKAYRNHGKHNHREFSPFTPHNDLASPYLPLLIVCDFNVNPIAWLIGQERNGDFYFFEEIFIQDTDTEEASVELCDRIATLFPNGHKPGAIVIGDASGAANKTSAAGETDYSILMRALNTKFGKLWASNETPDSNPPVKDRVNVMNGRLKAADGSVHFWYHPGRCPNLKKDFERVVWKPGASAVLDQKKDPMLTHISDAAGYGVYKRAGALWGSSPGSLRVIQR